MIQNNRRKWTCGREAMPTMKKTHPETAVRKLLMLGAALTLLLGLPFAFANRAFADPEFAYVANSQGGSVSAYTINSATGCLREVAGSPFAAGAIPLSVTVDPSGRFAYVVDNGGDTVSAYAINGSTGALRKVVGSPFPSREKP